MPKSHLTLSRLANRALKAPSFFAYVMGGVPPGVTNAALVAVSAVVFGPWIAIGGVITAAVTDDEWDF